MATIEQRVKQAVVEVLGCTENEVQNESHLMDDLGADSLDMVEFVMALEEEFDLDISDDDAEKLLTVQEAIDYVTGKMS